MENNEMKVRSIRADEATLEKFKLLSEEFPNQGECLSQLITAYEISTARQIIPNMETDIADFQANVDRIQQAFIHALELNNNAEQRIRAEFRHQLESKDKLIAELQERSEKAEQELAAAQEEYNAAESDYKAQIEGANADKVKTLAEVEKWQHEADSAVKAANDKQIIIDNLTARLPAQEETDKTIAGLKQQLETITAADREKFNKISELERSIRTIEQENKLALKAMEIESEKAVLSVRAEYQAKIEENTDRIGKLQEEISALKAENAQMKAANG